MILSIDPGLDTGWALWRAGRLAACGFGDPRACPLHVVLPRENGADSLHDVWIEDQVIYPRSKVPPSAVLALAKLAHRTAGRYDAVGVTVHFVEPARWKGQTPCTCSARNLDPAACTHHSRVWTALSAPERDIASAALGGLAPSKRHNVLDAIGIGQWVVHSQAGGASWH